MSLTNKQIQSTADFNELLDHIIDQKQLHRFEMSTRNLSRLVEIVEPECRGSVDTFLSNNPGAQDAIVEWIRNTGCEEWKSNIRREAVAPSHFSHHDFFNEFDVGDEIYLTNAGGPQSASIKMMDEDLVMVAVILSDTRAALILTPHHQDDCIWCSMSDNSEYKITE